MAALSSKVEEKSYLPLEAIQLVKDNATAKFDETIEAHIRLGIDPKYTDQQLRTTVALPKGTGQKVRIAVIAKGEKVAEATKAGADLAGEEDLIEINQINQLKIEEVIFALQDWFSSNENPKTLQNAKYDRLILLRHGIILNGVVIDTLLADYICDATLKHSLDEIAYREFGFKPKSFSDVVKK